MNKDVFIVFFSLWTSLLFGQELDSLNGKPPNLLNEILLSEDKFQNWAVGASVLNLDSTLKAYTHSDIANLLSSSSHIRIRSYGAGGLASSSIRGAGASHTQVLWNGIVLNQRTTGQQDLSLISAFFIDALNVQSGGLSSLLGEGAVGGAIHLKNTDNYNEGLRTQLHSSVGSFGYQSWAGKTQYSNAKLAVGFRMFRNSVKNNYPFKDPYLQGEIRELEHAQLKSVGVQTSVSYKLNKYWNGSLRYWHQEMDREIAPTLSEAFSVAEQQDEFDVFLFQLQHQKGRIKWNSQLAYQYSDLIYQDSIKDIFSHHKTQRYTFSQDAQWKIGVQQILRFENLYTYDDVTSASLLSDYTNESRFSSALNYRNWLSDQFLLVLGARQEVIDAKTSPFLPSIALKVLPNKNWNLECSWSKSYRKPSWNDRYWHLGGNPDLLEELGWMTNVRFGRGFIEGTLQKSVGLSMYFGRINNWIIWLPDGVESYWTPENLLLVEQKGLELELDFSYKNECGNWRYENKASYNSATNLKETVRGIGEINKQIIYVPAIQVNNKISLQKKNMEIYYQDHYESKRFTARDHSAYLEAYYVGTIGFHYKCKYHTNTLQVGLQCDNIWNTDYKLTEGRPMPGQSIRVNFNLYL